MLFSRRNIRAVAAQQCSAAYTTILLCHSCQIFRRQIPKPRPDELVVAHFAPHLRELCLKCKQAYAAETGQIEQVVRDLKVSALVIGVPVDRSVSLDLRKKAVVHKKPVHALRHDPDAADVVRVRPLQIFVVPDILKGAALKMNIFAPDALAVLRASPQPDAAGPYFVYAVRVNAFPCAVDKPDVFAPLQHHVRALPKDHVPNFQIFYVVDDDLNVLVLFVSSVHHAVALAQCRRQCRRIIRLAVSGSTVLLRRDRAGERCGLFQTGKPVLDVVQVCSSQHLTVPEALHLII